MILKLSLINVLFMGTALFCSAVEWLELRGGERQGVVEAEGVPVKIDFDKDVVWKTKIPGKGWSSPVMSQGVIIVTTAVGTEKVELRVVAVDEKTGKILWNEKVFEPSEEEVKSCHFKNSFASSTALISEGVVYAHFGHMGTAALALKTGAVKWRYHETFDSVHGNGPSPILSDGVLVFTADGKDEALVRALDAQTGKKLWEKNREIEATRKFSFGTPLQIEMDGEPVVVTQGSEVVMAHRVKDGKLLWWLDAGDVWSVIPTPIVDEGVVYLSTGFGKTRLLAIELEGAKGDIKKTHVKWEAKKGVPTVPSFVIKDHTIYLLEDKGKLSALNKEDGKTLWATSLKRNFSGSPILVGNHFYSFTEEGVGYVHKVTPEGAEKLAENDFEEPIFSSPIMYDKTMILRSETTLWRFGKSF